MSAPTAAIRPSSIRTAVAPGLPKTIPLTIVSSFRIDGVYPRVPVRRPHGLDSHGPTVPWRRHRDRVRRTRRAVPRRAVRPAARLRHRRRRPPVRRPLAGYVRGRPPGEDRVRGPLDDDVRRAGGGGPHRRRAHRPRSRPWRAGGGEVRRDGAGRAGLGPPGVGVPAGHGPASAHHARVRAAPRPARLDGRAARGHPTDHRRRAGDPGLRGPARVAPPRRGRQPADRRDRGPGAWRRRRGGGCGHDRLRRGRRAATSPRRRHPGRDRAGRHRGAPGHGGGPVCHR